MLFIHPPVHIYISVIKRVPSGNATRGKKLACLLIKKKKIIFHKWQIFSEEKLKKYLGETKIPL